jgi:predicted transcriptional regulator with HTH domain
MRNKRLKQGDMKQNIYNWYSSEYPNDYQLDEIDRNVTFEDINGYKGCIYDLIGDIDTLIVDRVFERLEELKEEAL